MINQSEHVNFLANHDNLYLRQKVKSFPTQALWNDDPAFDLRLTTYDLRLTTYDLRRMTNDE